MTSQEVLIFKQYDSKTSIGGRFCFHTALNSPLDTNPHLPTRQSCEVRALLFFAQREDEPNTCPEVKPHSSGAGSSSGGYFSWVLNLFSPSDITVDEGARRCENAIVYLSWWPKDIVLYIKMRKDRPEAAEELATRLAEDRHNHLKMRHLSVEKKKEIVKRLMATGWEKKFRTAFA